jgi:hypothetical protein
VALIALGRAAGFSLDEIALMFAPDGRLRIDRRKLSAKAEELDRTIRKLSAMRDSLRHAAKEEGSAAAIEMSDGCPYGPCLPVESLGGSPV